MKLIATLRLVLSKTKGLLVIDAGGPKVDCISYTKLMDLVFFSIACNHRIVTGIPKILILVDLSGGNFPHVFKLSLPMFRTRIPISRNSKIACHHIRTLLKAGELYLTQCHSFKISKSGGYPYKGFTKINPHHPTRFLVSRKKDEGR